MKVQYFTQQRADADDELLLTFTEKGVVPETCLLGGQMILSILQAGPEHDPCEWCAGPRDRCGGRPQKYGAGDGDEIANLDAVIGAKDVGARRAERKNYIECLEAMIEREEEKQ